mgnify:CR=1 FL=1
MNIQNYITRIDIKLREKLNPYLGPLRRRLGGGENAIHYYF